MITGVTFILLQPSGKMLLQQRDDGCGKVIAYPNMWCFPGGGKHKGELYLETVVREVKEEFELTVTKDSCILLTQYDHDSIVNDHVFICPIATNIHPVLREGQDMQWLNLDEIKLFSLAWEQDKILNVLKKFIETYQSYRR